MIMIIGCHLAVDGVNHYHEPSISYVAYNSGSFINKIFTDVLSPGGSVGVALFFMLTGFFLCKKEHVSVKKVVLETTFYSFIIGFLLIGIISVDRLLGGGIIHDLFPGWNVRSVITYLLTSFFRPVTWNWWFIAVYILLVFASTLINKLINSFSKHGLILFIFFIWFFYYSFDSVFNSPYSRLVQAFFFYVLGAFTNLHCKTKISKANTVSYILICVLTWAIMTFCIFFKRENSWTNLTGNLKFIKILQGELVDCISDCILIPSFVFCFFRLFASLDFNNSFAINKIASFTFGVYLIHASNLFAGIIWNKMLRITDFQFSSKYFPFFAIVDILIVFIVCSFFDMLRQKFAEPYYLKIADKVENKIKHTVVTD